MTTKNEPKNEVNPDVAALLAEFRAEREAHRTEREALVALVAKLGSGAPIVTESARNEAARAEYRELTRKPSVFAIRRFAFTMAPDGADGVLEDGTIPVGFEGVAYEVTKPGGPSHIYKIEGDVPAAHKTWALRKCILEDGGVELLARFDDANPLAAADRAAIEKNAIVATKTRLATSCYQHVLRTLISVLRPEGSMTPSRLVTVAMAKARCLSFVPLDDEPAQVAEAAE